VALAAGGGRSNPAAAVLFAGRRRGCVAAGGTAAGALAWGAALAPYIFRMTDYFRRQLVYYADAHRNPVNSVMHIVGNPILFVAVVLPLCLLPVSVLGLHTSAASLLVIPALILWTAWDVGIGLAIVVSSVPLLLAASAIAGHLSVLWVWITAIVLFVLGWALQIVGHQLFEGKRPTLLDNPVQMLISPMFIFAKLFIALGLRPDLAAVLQNSSERQNSSQQQNPSPPTPFGSPRYPVEGRADAGRTP
jgi:uncharacterized membrane protein YGL010W